jgi:Carboxypeptidase regulatory-like domain
VHILSVRVLRCLITKTLPASFVLVVFAGQWVLAPPAGSIRGSVTDSSGAPILGAVVTAEGAAGNCSTTVTDGEGAFKISSLTLGSY